MNSEIKNLLQKYFQGETSLHDEKRLRTYFNNEEVEESLKQFQPLFQYFEKEKEMSLGEDFENKVLLNLPKNGQVVPFKSKRNYFLRIAATLLILAASVFYFQEQKPTQATAINWEKYEIKDPEKAFETTKSALFFLSTKMNKGVNTATNEVSKVQKATRFFK